jgi:hypothetical protein
MTLEELQQENLDLREQLNTVTSERDALSENNKTLSTSLEEARTLNQKMFLELRATSQSADGKTNNEDQETESCADFAKKLSI